MKFTLLVAGYYCWVPFADIVKLYSSWDFSGVNFTTIDGAEQYR